MEQLVFPVTKKAAEKQGGIYSSEANKNAQFPSRLRELRKGKGISQDQLSKELCVSKSTIGLYETGDTLPDAKTLRDLAVYFDVSADWLLGLSSKRSPDIDVRKMADTLHLSDIAICTLQIMAEPDNLGGDPEVLFALNAMLEAMASRDDSSKFILVDIANYLKFEPIEEEKFTNELESLSNIPRDALAHITNEALKAQLLQEIGTSLDKIRARYYQ